MRTSVYFLTVGGLANTFNDVLHRATADAPSDQTSQIPVADCDEFQRIDQCRSAFWRLPR